MGWQFPRSMLIAALAAVSPLAGCSPSAPAEPSPTEGAGTQARALNGSASVEAKFVTSRGWVRPGDVYPFLVTYSAGAEGAVSGLVEVVLPPSAKFVSSTPAPTAGTGTAQDPLLYQVGPLEPDAGGRIVLQARAMTTVEDPEIIWKDLSATATFTPVTLAGTQPTLSSRTHGPRVTELESARYGDRPFAIINVEYQDITHCTGVGTPYEECTGNHTSAGLDTAVNGRGTASLYELYQEISLGQLFPWGAVPSAGKDTVPFDAKYPHRFSKLEPSGLCTGTTIATVGGVPTHGTPVYPNRIVKGWYKLPGTQSYYGGDRTGHALAGALTGAGLLFGVDDACGPTGKLVYDAATLADPDLDYNDFDTDRDGVVDFFMVVFAGDGGNGNISTTGLNNIWPHSSDLRYYFTDAAGQTGYVSNDQLRNHLEQPLWYTDKTRSQLTTEDMGPELKAYVRVGPYNVNPEPSIDKMSVIAHEYGHSLGLPDFYSMGSRSTFGTWELMAADHAQFMTVYARQKMGWVVPKELEDGTLTLRESKHNTHSLTWKRPDGTPYTLNAPNADVFRVSLPTQPLIDQTASGTRAWFSGAGNDFGCPDPGKPSDAGRGLLVQLPELASYKGGKATLKFKTNFEIEWDYDYGFVLVSNDGGKTWKSLASKKGTTISGYNPNANGCYTKWGHGITGVSGQSNTQTNTARHLGTYAKPAWVDDEFDLSGLLNGEPVWVLFSYSTDPGLKKRGWFIDDIQVSAGTTAADTVVYQSDFEQDDESTRLFPSGKAGWSWVSSDQGVPADHAYWIELRDRVSWDFDGKGQSDRGLVTWQPGVSIIYADESRGYGNVGVDDPPAVTPVDAVPQPGSSSPNLDDAAFTQERNLFDSCTHVDNYVDPAAEDELWRLPSGLRLMVNALSGLSDKNVPSPSLATAALTVDVAPDCSIPPVAAPTLAFGADRQDPDPDGTYTLTWERPAGAVGPDRLEETTVLEALVADGAEAGLGKWVATTSGTGAQGWKTDGKKRQAGSFAFHVNGLDGVTNAASILTLKEPITIPETGVTDLTFWDWYVGEGDDAVYVEVGDAAGESWEVVHTQTRAELAVDAAVLFAEEGMFKHSISLARWKGKSVKVRFRLQLGAENRAGSSPAIGWYVDNVSIDTADWKPLVTASTGTQFTRVGRLAGTYYYRVRTQFPFGSVATLESPWSDVISTKVTNTTVVDSDNDNVPDPDDNCPNTHNPDQKDTDGDGAGDVCDACPADGQSDADGDGVCQSADNCPQVSNPNQADTDGDGIGDACDLCAGDKQNDPDKDGVCGKVDNCPNASNPDQADSNGNGKGDVCDCADGDRDTVCDNADNCPEHANADQKDANNNGRGDVCEAPQACTGPDTDGDGVCNASDNCPAVANPDQKDGDKDGRGDACDADRLSPTPTQASGCSTAGGSVWPVLMLGLALVLVHARRRRLS